MRRRSLLAANSNVSSGGGISKYPWENTRPPASTKFEFPFYINTKVVADDLFGKYGYLELEWTSDELYDEFYEWYNSVVVTQPLTQILSREILQECPIYIDGNRLLFLKEEMGVNFGSEFETDGFYFGGDISEISFSSSRLFIYVDYQL